jgi:hypothetical protein
MNPRPFVSIAAVLLALTLQGDFAAGQTLRGPTPVLPPGKGAPMPPRPDPVAIGPDGPEWTFGLEARMPILKGDPASFNPDVGIGIGIHFARAFRRWFRLRVAVDHDRIFSNVPVTLPGAGFNVTRGQNITSTAFLVEPMFRVEHGWFAAHLLVGAGLWLAFYNNAEAEESRKVSRTSLLPGVRLEAGVTFRVHRNVELGLAFGYDFRRDSTKVPTSSLPGAPLRRVFDDQMGLALRVDYLF